MNQTYILNREFYASCMNKISSLVKIPRRQSYNFLRSTQPPEKHSAIIQFNLPITGERAQILVSDRESHQQLLAGGDTVK